ncbi:MAG: amidohydrolase [Chitinophagales bacterium]|nr:amidohydrolase [Chitinophagales bacterium]
MPEKFPRWSKKFGYGGFIYLEHHKLGCAKMMKDDEFFREILSNCWDPEVRMSDCDMFNVDIQVLSTIPVLFNYWAKPKDCLEISRFLNDHISEVVERYPKRFIGLGTIPMQDTDLAIQEMERCVKKLGLPGIEIGSNINDMNLNEPQFFPIFEAAQELGASIFIHPWNMMGKALMEKYWLPWLVGMPAETSRAICSLIFGGVFERLPDLKVAFAHGGGSFPATFGRVEHGFNVRPDLCAIDNNVGPRKYIKQFYYDALVHDEKALEYLVNFAGADRVALGTDYPFPLGDLEPGKLIESSGFDTTTKEKLLGGTALDWLGIPKEQFV